MMFILPHLPQSMKLLVKTLIVRQAAVDHPASVATQPRGVRQDVLPILPQLVG